MRRRVMMAPTPRRSSGSVQRTHNQIHPPHLLPLQQVLQQPLPVASAPRKVHQLIQAPIPRQQAHGGAGVKHINVLLQKGAQPLHCLRRGQAGRVGGREGQAREQAGREKQQMGKSALDGADSNGSRPATHGGCR